MTIGVPLALVAALSVALAETPAAALARAPLVFGAMAFAAITGATLGGLSAVCGRLGGRRGRLLLTAAVLVPWAIAHEAGHGAWSIPGALEAFRSSVLPGHIREASIEAIAAAIGAFR